MYYHICTKDFTLLHFAIFPQKYNYTHNIIDLYQQPSL